MCFNTWGENYCRKNPNERGTPKHPYPRKKIKDEFDGVSAKIKSAEYRSTASTFKIIQNFFLLFINLLGKVFKLVGILIGILFLIISSVIFTVLINSIFSIWLMGFYKYPKFFENFSIEPYTPFNLISFLVLVSLLIPVIFLFLLGIKLLKTKSKSISLPGKLILLGIWMFSIFSFLFLGFIEAKSQFFTSKINQSWWLSNIHQTHLT